MVNKVTLERAVKIYWPIMRRFGFSRAAFEAAVMYDPAAWAPLNVRAQSKRLGETAWEEARDYVTSILRPLPEDECE